VAWRRGLPLSILPIRAVDPSVRVWPRMRHRLPCADDFPRGRLDCVRNRRTDSVVPQRQPAVALWRCLHIRSRLRRPHGGRSGLREAREPAQRILDDLVQGHAILLLRGGLPAQIRPQAGALPATRAGSATERSRLLIRARRPHSKLRNASAGGMREARMAGLAAARTAAVNAIPTISPRARYASKRLNTPIVVSRIWLMNSWMFSVISWYERKYRSRSWPARVTSTPVRTWK